MDCDILVVGGGINGAGIARDAAGRGLSVVLCEQDDLAAHTSSASTKLIHGGLRYLEHYEFGLVHKALIEREVLMRAAPHLIQPLHFVMPHLGTQRPAWLIRAGLFLYDHLARRTLLPASRRIALREHAAGAPLRVDFSTGFSYADACVDDARLVVSCALDAAARGARILTRTRCARLERIDGAWLAHLEAGGQTALTVRARCVVNAAGPWVAGVSDTAGATSSPRSVRLVKGSHMVVRKLFDHDYAYLFQHPDGRIVFAIPYHGDFTLIGTTDVEYAGDPRRVEISADEVEYLCALCNRYFQKSVHAADVVWSYAGVRPLAHDQHADPSAVTRDYHFALDAAGAPLLSVFGGKITTFRKLAEDALDRLSVFFPKAGAAWTAQACLPGGDIAGGEPCDAAVLRFAEYVTDLQSRFDWLPAHVVARYARAYGSWCALLLDGRRSLADMGAELAPGLFAAEAHYWLQHEWALTCEDMLWRRSKLGLWAADGGAKLKAWLDGRDGDAAAGGSQPEHRG